MRWNAAGDLLALATTDNRLFVIDYKGTVIFSQQSLVSTKRDITALTWAHDDQIIILACGIPLIFLLVFKFSFKWKCVIYTCGCKIRYKRCNYKGFLKPLCIRFAKQRLLLHFWALPASWD